MTEAGFTQVLLEDLQPYHRKSSTCFPTKRFDVSGANSSKRAAYLMAGADPTGWGAVIAGFADQRGLELLVEAAFTPEEAIRIATFNGAIFLGLADRIGTLTVGKQAASL